jgi:3-deoxy-D-manno-octulosonic acid (KDO) 8-phosphate synthase
MSTIIYFVDWVKERKATMGNDNLIIELLQSLSLIAITDFISEKKVMFDFITSIQPTDRRSRNSGWDYFSNSISPGRQVLSNQGSRGP